jgi:hypothetical protein
MCLPIGYNTGEMERFNRVKKVSDPRFSGEKYERRTEPRKE